MYENNLDEHWHPNSFVLYSIGKFCLISWLSIRFLFFRGGWTQIVSWHHEFMISHPSKIVKFITEILSDNFVLYFVGFHHSISSLLKYPKTVTISYLSISRLINFNNPLSLFVLNWNKSFTVFWFLAFCRIRVSINSFARLIVLNINFNFCVKFPHSLLFCILFNFSYKLSLKNKESI